MKRNMGKKKRRKSSKNTQRAGEKLHLTEVSLPSYVRAEWV